eukprot:TRINITY_DN31042_c1_g1_i1.p1 TRINITY_DN31042_c1_g1~~TRINITY_DN31042_c1_g1_i1.p1  ORF type:complete len:243 (+),score=106.58 TRINITY_DN31042_c1_g1_i1:53-781(+)
MNADTVNVMLTKSSGRDLLMGVAQFLPGVLIPVAERSGNTELVKSLESMASLSGNYRSVTRLTSLFTMLTKRGLPKLPEDAEGAVSFMSWLCGAIFLPLENEAVYTAQGVLNRQMTPQRKEELGPRCVYFWFWSLVFEQVGHLIKFVRQHQRQAKGEQGEEGDRFVLGQWVQSFLWFLMAWASMPATGTVKLLQNPEGSLLKPLHLLVEKTTVNGIALSPLTRAACGLGATALQISDYFESK